MQDCMSSSRVEDIALRLNALTAEVYSLREEFDKVCAESGIDKRLIPVYDKPEKVSDWIARHGFLPHQYNANNTGIPLETLKQLYEKQACREERKKKHITRKDSFEIDGVVFDSISDFAKKMGIQRGSVYTAATRGRMTAKEACQKIYRRHQEGYELDGEKFPSKKALAKELGVSYGILCWYLEEHEGEKSFTRKDFSKSLKAYKENHKRKPTRSTKVSIDGYEWPSMTAFVKDMGLSSLSAIYSYARLHGITPEQRMVEVFRGINRRPGRKPRGKR